MRALTDLTGEVGSVSESDRSEIAAADLHGNIQAVHEEDEQYCNRHQLPCFSTGCRARDRGTASGLDVKSTQVSSMYGFTAKLPA